MLQISPSLPPICKAAVKGHLSPPPPMYQHTKNVGEGVKDNSVKTV